MPEGIPVDQVITLRNQGLSNDQIIQNLQRFGFGLDQINSAIMQADMKEGTMTSPYPMRGPGGSQGLNAPQGGDSFDMPQSPGDMGQNYSQAVEWAPAEDKIHEIAEAIINEKWTELIDRVNKIIDWKDSVENRMGKMEQQLADISHAFDKLHEGVLGKIADYDRSVMNLGTEIKALEKVFQKILPGFVENVNELSRITSRVKGSVKK